MRLISSKSVILALIQSGLVGNSSVGKILIGMRATLSAPLNLIPVSICLLSPYIKFHFILNNYN